MKQYFSFQWHITDDCDQQCKHCYIFSEDCCKPLESMTWEQMQEVVANCCDMCELYGRLPYFYITGGDPILHPDFWRLLGLLAWCRGCPAVASGTAGSFFAADPQCWKMKNNITGENLPC